MAVRKELLHSLQLAFPVLTAAFPVLNVTLQDTLRNRHGGAAYKNEDFAKRRISHQLSQFQCGKFDASQRNINAIDDADSILLIFGFSLMASNGWPRVLVTDPS